MQKKIEEDNLQLEVQEPDHEDDIDIVKLEQGEIIEDEVVENGNDKSLIVLPEDHIVIVEE